MKSRRGEFQGPVVASSAHVVEPALVPVEEVGGGGDVGAPIPVAVTNEDAAGEGTGHREDAYIGAAHFYDVEEEVAFVRPGVSLFLGADS